MKTPKFNLVNVNDGNETLEILEATTPEEAAFEALEMMGWGIVEVAENEEEEVQ